MEAVLVGGVFHFKPRARCPLWAIAVIDPTFKPAPFQHPNLKRYDVAD
jgi:hypothetical protein